MSDNNKGKIIDENNPYIITSTTETNPVTKETITTKYNEDGTVKDRIVTTKLDLGWRLLSASANGDEKSSDSDKSVKDKE